METGDSVAVQLRALEDRLAGFLARDDPSSLTSDEALADVQRLMEAPELASGIPLGVAAPVAWFHWYRAKLLPGAAAAADRQSAMSLFVEIARVDPALLPVTLLQQLAPMTNSADAWLAQGRKLLAHAGAAYSVVHLEAALERLFSSLEDQSLDDLARMSCELDLGMGVQLRFENLERSDDLEAAIDLGRFTLSTMPEDHPLRTRALSQLATALSARFERIGESSDIDEAIRLFRAALEGRGADGLGRQGHRANLVAALTNRFQYTHVEADVSEAIELARVALAESTDGTPHVVPLMINLVRALTARFERFGLIDDLDESIRELRAAVVRSRQGTHQHAMILAQLGKVLLARFKRYGAESDLIESIDALRAVVLEIPNSHPDHGHQSTNMAVALGFRFLLHRDAEDLRKAATIVRTTLARTAVDHPERAWRLTVLGTLLGLAAENGLYAGMDDAITALKEALGTGRLGPSARVDALCNLSQALRIQFESSRAPEYLDEAIVCAEAAIRDLPVGDFRRFTGLMNRANALRLRHEDQGDLNDLGAAKDSWEEAAALEAVSAESRVQAARGWGSAAASLNDWEAASKAYQVAVEALPRAAWLGLDRRDRERVLSQWTSLSSNAAASFAALDRPQEAVQWSDAGRGVLWGQILDLRRDFLSLGARSPEILTRLQQIQWELGAGPDLLHLDSADPPEPYPRGEDAQS